MGQLAVDGHDEGVGVIQVAGVAGAEIAIAIGVRDGGGAAVRLYSRDQACAFFGIEEIASDEQRDVFCRHTLDARVGGYPRSEEHTSELQSLMRISYAVFCLKKKTKKHR